MLSFYFAQTTHCYCYHYYNHHHFIKKGYCNTKKIFKELNLRIKSNSSQDTSISTSTLPLSSFPPSLLPSLLPSLSLFIQGANFSKGVFNWPKFIRFPPPWLGEHRTFQEAFL